MYREIEADLPLIKAFQFNSPATGLVRKKFQLQYRKRIKSSLRLRPLVCAIQIVHSVWKRRHLFLEAAYNFGS